MRFSKFFFFLFGKIFLAMFFFSLNQVSPVSAQSTVYWADGSTPVFVKRKARKRRRVRKRRKAKLNRSRRRYKKRAYKKRRSRKRRVASRRTRRHKTRTKTRFKKQKRTRVRRRKSVNKTRVARVKRRRTAPETTSSFTRSPNYLPSPDWHEKPVKATKATVASQNKENRLSQPDADKADKVAQNNSFFEKIIGKNGLNTTVTAINFQRPGFMTYAAKSGESLFERECESCHGEDGLGGRKGPSLLQTLYGPTKFSDFSMYSAPKTGVIQTKWRFGDMPKAKGLSETDLHNLVIYIRTLQRHNGIK